MRFSRAVAIVVSVVLAQAPVAALPDVTAHRLLDTRDVLLTQTLNLPGTVYFSELGATPKQEVAQAGGNASRSVRKKEWTPLRPSRVVNAALTGVLLTLSFVDSMAPMKAQPLAFQVAVARRPATTQQNGMLAEQGLAMRAPDAFASIFVSGMKVLNDVLTPATLNSTEFPEAIRLVVAEGLANASAAPANSDTVRRESLSLIARLIDAGFFNDMEPAQAPGAQTPNVMDRFLDNALKIASDGFPTSRARAFDVLFTLAQPRTIHLIYNRLDFLEKALAGIRGLTGSLSARPAQIQNALRSAEVRSRIDAIRKQGGTRKQGPEAAKPAAAPPPAGVVKPIDLRAIVNTFTGYLSGWWIYFGSPNLPTEIPKGLDGMSLFGFAYRGGQLVMGTEPRHQQEAEQKIADWKKRAPGKPFVITIVNDNLDSGVAKDPELVRRLLATAASREAHIDQLVALVAKTGANGIEMDWERVPYDVRGSFTEFIKRLREKLPKDKLLYVVSEPRTADTTTGNSAGIDWHAIHPYVNRLVLMTYYENYPGGPRSGPTATVGFIGNLVAYAIAPSPRAGGQQLPGVPKEKLGVALTMTALDSPIDDKGQKTGPGQIIRGEELERVKAQATQSGRDADGLPYFRYRGVGNQLREVWYSDASSINVLSTAAQKLGVPYVALWSLDWADQPVRYWMNLKPPAKQIGWLLLLPKGIHLFGQSTHSPSLALRSAA